jgi:post-segregation antitoxin (ccd killing protein)
MGKEELTIEVDADLLAQLRAAGVDPQAHVERILRRHGLANLSVAEREARREAWRKQHRDELGSYDHFIEENGLWSDGLRAF